MHTCTNRGGGQQPCANLSVWVLAAEADLSAAVDVTHSQTSVQSDTLRSRFLAAIYAARKHTSEIKPVENLRDLVFSLAF